MIWKNCSGHAVVEFKTGCGWSLHCYKSCKEPLWSISYEFEKLHVRKADEVQRNDCTYEPRKLGLYPSFLTLLPTTSPSKKENPFSHSEPLTPTFPLSLSRAAGAKGSLKLSSHVYSKAVWELFSAMVWSTKSEGIISDKPEMAPTWEA